MGLDDLIPSMEEHNTAVLSAAQKVQAEIDEMNYIPHIGLDGKRNLRPAASVHDYSNCFEGALYASYRMWAETGIQPRLLVIYNDKDRKESGHAVCFFEVDGKFYSIGQSKHSELKGRLMPHNSLTELANSYKIELAKKGYHPVGYKVFALDVNKREIGLEDPNYWINGENGANHLIEQVLEGS